jgi:hypothetical protein
MSALVDPFGRYGAGGLDAPAATAHPHTLVRRDHPLKRPAGPTSALMALARGPTP